MEAVRINLGIVLSPFCVCVCVYVCETWKMVGSQTQLCHMKCI